MQTRHFPTACFSALQNIAVSIVSDDRETILRTIDAALSSPVFSSKGWQANLTKLRSVVSSVSLSIPSSQWMVMASFPSFPFHPCPVLLARVLARVSNSAIRFVHGGTLHHSCVKRKMLS